MGDYKINGVPIKELMKKPVFADLSKRMETLFADIDGEEDAKELMAIYGILTAGLIHFYAGHSSQTPEEQLEEFSVLVKYCLESVSVVKYRVH